MFVAASNFTAAVCAVLSLYACHEALVPTVQIRAASDTALKCTGASLLTVVSAWQQRKMLKC